jgi:hypothetical protein
MKYWLEKLSLMAAAMLVAFPVFAEDLPEADWGDGECGEDFES